MGVPDMTVGTVFTPILCETRFHETDDVGCKLLVRDGMGWDMWGACADPVLFVRILQCKC